MVQLSVLEIVVCLSEVIDLMSEEIKDHHKRVACGAYQLCQAAGIGGVEQRDIVIAAALHDIGGLSLEARKCAALHFEDTNSHAEKGYKLLAGFEPFHNVANNVRYHHTKWDGGNGVQADGRALQLGSQIILLADRIAVNLAPGIHTLNQAEGIINNVLEGKNTLYSPEIIDCFMQVSGKDAFWLNIMTQDYYEKIMQDLKEFDMLIEDKYLDQMLLLISNIVDFRSVFTTVHSTGVAVVVQELARLMGEDKELCYLLKIAAMLHDVGKLAVPTEIIEKPGPLSVYERDVIRTHSYYTDKVLSRLSGLENIRVWASSHHENLNGKGYPFGYTEEELPLGARIMKVGDVFVALTEDRPYREGMPAEKALEIIQVMAIECEVDTAVVAVLEQNLKRIDMLRIEAEADAKEKYRDFVS